jgi:glycosyltransferase involved in cell wall biosynthesis
MKPYSLPRVLVISAGPVSEQLTGVAIRAVELARALAPHAEVTVAGVTPSSSCHGLSVISYELFGERRKHALAAHIAQADFIVAQPPWPVVARWLRHARGRLIYDLYDPEPFEIIELLRDRHPLLRRLVYTLTTDRVLDGMACADHIMCASEKQRDLWIGALLAERRIVPRLYDRDPTLRELIDCVPFGLPNAPPEDNGQDPLRERFPAIADDDEVVLWNGGIWAWLDARCAIRAIEILGERRPQAKLVFMGAATLPAAREAEAQARALASELGLLDRQVFFNDGWVSYEQRAGWLLRSACVISTHTDHLETRFAFRTRMLDALWATLPIVCTEGDDLADRVARENLGVAVPPADPTAVASALEQVLVNGREHYRQQLLAAAAEQTWSRVAAPLVSWVSDPAMYSSSRERGHVRGAQRLRSSAFDLVLSTLGRLGISRLPSL